MRLSPKKQRILLTVLFFVLGVFAYFVVGVFRFGVRDTGALENIDGIPYPLVDGAVHITEKLAHADIYLSEPVLFKRLVLTITFDPRELSALHVGVRENSFWLSYPKMTLYDGNTDPGLHTREISIPLTDKLQEADGSVDMMFFAEHSRGTAEIDEGIADPTHWVLYTIEARTEPVMPTYAQLKDYIRSKVYREKAL